MNCVPPVIPPPAGWPASTFGRRGLTLRPPPTLLPGCAQVVESTATRAELVEALEEVAEGRMPRDRVALRELADELSNWPGLNEMAAKLQAQGEVEGGGGEGETLRKLDADVADRPAVAPPIMGSKYQEAEGDVEKSPLNSLKDFFGLSTLYILSAIPIFIGVTAVAVLFANSLR